MRSASPQETPFGAAVNALQQYREMNGIGAPFCRMSDDSRLS
jgi:hypothetical protein